MMSLCADEVVEQVLLRVRQGRLEEPADPEGEEPGGRELVAGHAAQEVGPAELHAEPVQPAKGPFRVGMVKPRTTARKI